jgi:hypothetical protein
MAEQHPRSLRVRAAEEYWWHTSVLKSGDSSPLTRDFADAAIIALESALSRMYDAAHGRGELSQMLSSEDVEVLVCGLKDRVSQLENLLAAAYEAYADDGFLVTKNEWLQSLELHVKETEDL